MHDCRHGAVFAFPRTFEELLLGDGTGPAVTDAFTVRDGPPPRSIHGNTDGYPNSAGRIAASFPAAPAMRSAARAAFSA